MGGGWKGNVPGPGVKCEFSQSGIKWICTVTFPARYLMPMSLEAGKTPGIGIRIHDRDSREGHVKQNFSNIPLKEGDAFQRPDLYTQLLFVPGTRKPQEEENVRTGEAQGLFPLLTIVPPRVSRGTLFCKYFAVSI